MTTTLPGPEDASSDRWEALGRYLAGESPPQEAEALERWLAEDPRRRRLLSALNERLGELAAAAPSSLDVEAALAKVSARLHEPEVIPLPARVPGSQEHARAASRRTLLKVAAVVALALGSGLIWQTLRVNAPPAEGRAFATGVGQTDSVTLSDGTRVLLGPDSRLAVAAGFGDENREVELSGEARFEVVHDETRPFLVRAGQGRIEDLGTAFTVRAAGDGEVRVVVTEGSVRLARADATGGSGVILSAGDRGRLPESGAAVAERSAIAESDLAWTRGQLVFEDATIARVATDLRRWYGVELRVSDPALAERHVTTTAFQGEPAQEVVRVIGLMLGAEVQMRGDTAVLNPAAAP